MGALGLVITKIFDLLFLPFGWSALVGIAVWSAVLGAVFVKAYGLVTNQAAIKAVKRRMGAAVLEVRLFQQDITVLLRAQRRLFAAVGGYGWQAGRSIVILLPIAFLLMFQFSIRHDTLPLAPNSIAEVTVELSEDAPRAAAAPELTTEGVEVMGDPFRVGKTEHVFKVKTRLGGERALVFEHEGEKQAIPIYVGNADKPGKLYRRTTKNNFADDLETPGGPRFDGASHFQSIEIDYPRIDSVFGLGHWFGLPAACWFFFVISLIAGFALKDKLGVEI